MMFAVMLSVMLVMAVIFVFVVMFTGMFVPPEMLAVVVMLVLFLFFGDLGLAAFLKDLLLALPVLTPVAIAPGVDVAPLVALVPRMRLLPAREAPPSPAQLLRDARMVLKEALEIRMLRQIGRVVDQRRIRGERLRNVGMVVQVVRQIECRHVRRIGRRSAGQRLIQRRILVEV